MKQNLIQHIRAIMARSMGTYRDLEKALEDLSPQALQDLHRLLQNKDQETTAAVNRARMTPWRRG